MGSREQGSKEGPFRAETVQGEPWEVAGWRLTPVARLISFGRAKATIGTKEIGGWGAGVVRITPVAVRAESAGEVAADRHPGSDGGDGARSVRPGRGDNRVLGLAPPVGRQETPPGGEHGRHSGRVTAIPAGQSDADQEDQRMTINRLFDSVDKMRDTAQWRAVFGEPETVEGKTLIPVAQVGYGFGLGFGQGSRPTEAEEEPPAGGEGGGGGGGASAKPLGTIVVTPKRSITSR